MSVSTTCELSAAVHDRLKRCTVSESMCVLAQFVGVSLATAPESHRGVALALFVDLAKQAATNALIGDPIGRA
jgi:hypothetical protein